MLKRFLLLIGLVLICDVAFGQKATLLADGAKEKDQNKSHVSLEAYDQGSSVIYATNDVKLYITKLRMSKTAGGINDEDRRFNGLNSVLLADKGSRVTIDDCEIRSNTPLADGVSAIGAGTEVRMTKGLVATTRVNSSGVNALKDGLVYVTATEVNTYSNQSAAFFTAQGGKMDISEAIGSSNGQASPLFYSSGTLNGYRCHMSSAKWTIGNVDGGTLTLDKNELTSGGICGFLLYNVNVKEGLGILNLSNNKITVNEGPVFLVTNTPDAAINLTGNKIKCKDGELLSVRADDWGEKGRNGGHVSMFVGKQSLTGDISVDSISGLYLELKGGSKLTGQINARENRCATVQVKLNAKSTWVSKGDSYLTSIVFEQPVEKAVKSLKGKHTIYYDPSDPANAPLGGKEYKTGGGRLCPLK